MGPPSSAEAGSLGIQSLFVGLGGWRLGQPCPRCGTKVQRIRYADNETNYCPVCQTGGKLLADRGLSRLLREDWPRTLEELEGLRRPVLS